ncbi:50S ribosomal protein L10, partial [Candidatus Saccharibacteria bacterium]|nr:50S ribosomal protein L10 [Candidatus Saccharibacteria bacterium]
DPLGSIRTVVSSFGEEAIKFGVFEGNLIEAEEVLELARLPSEEFLKSRLVGVLQTPVSKFTFVLKGTQKNLVSVLSEVGKARGGG